MKVFYNKIYTQGILILLVLFVSLNGYSQDKKIEKANEAFNNKCLCYKLLHEIRTHIVPPLRPMRSMRRIPPGPHVPSMPLAHITTTTGAASATNATSGTN